MSLNAETAAVPATDTEPAFAEDVRTGLGRHPKRLSCRYLYDEEGSRLFEAICELPEYYLTRAERQILHVHAPEIVEQLAPTTSLIELGSGSAAKTCFLIGAFLRAHRQGRYLPVDISHTALAASCARLARSWPGLEVLPIAAEYHAGLERAWASEQGRDKLVLWLGSSIGNYSRDGACDFLRGLWSLLAPRDRVLVGIDLRKRREVLEHAYDDRAGVTARFNLNLLRRINRELGGEFDLARFEHRALYDEGSGCVGMFLVSRGAQRVRIARLDLTVELADGEAIHTESSYKYSPAEIDALATKSGFAVHQRWSDARGRFSLNLLGAVQR